MEEVTTKETSTGQAYCVWHVVLLEETNAVGGVVYFSNFIKWQGMAREMILRKMADFKKALSSPIEMITRSCSARFLEHLRFGDKIRIEVQTERILPTSFIMLFRYYHDETNRLIASGDQKVTFFDTQSQQPCRIPEEILNLVKKVQIRNGRLNA